MAGPIVLCLALSCRCCCCQCCWPRRSRNYRTENCCSRNYCSRRTGRSGRRRPARHRRPISNSPMNGSPFYFNNVLPLEPIFSYCLHFANFLARQHRALSERSSRSLFGCVCSFPTNNRPPLSTSIHFALQMFTLVLSSQSASFAFPIEQSSFTRVNTAHDGDERRETRRLFPSRSMNTLFSFVRLLLETLLLDKNMYRVICEYGNNLISLVFACECPVERWKKRNKFPVFARFSLPYCFCPAASRTWYSAAATNQSQTFQQSAKLSSNCHCFRYIRDER